MNVILSLITLKYYDKRKILHVLKLAEDSLC